MKIMNLTFSCVALAVICSGLLFSPVQASSSSKTRVVKGPETYTDIQTKKRIEEQRQQQGQKNIRYVKVYKPAHEPTWTWTPDLAPDGSVKVEIFIKEQRMFIWRGGEIIAETEVSTGRPGHDTPAGYYKIVQKRKDHASNLYGSIINRETGKIVNGDATPATPVPEGCYYRPAPMPHFQRLTFTGIGFHAGYLPGHADSHGCVRLPDVMAENVFTVTDVGTEVVVYPYMGAEMPKTAKNDFTRQVVSKPKVTASASSKPPATEAAISPSSTIVAGQTSPRPARAPVTPANATTADRGVKPEMESFIPAKP